MTLQDLLSDDVRGHTRLWVVFWIYGALLSHLFFGTILYFHFYRQTGTPLMVVMLAGFVAYTAWIMRAVWINAYNVEKAIHGQIARYLTVAWALNAVLVSIFLLLGHLGAVAMPI